MDTGLQEWASLKIPLVQHLISAGAAPRRRAEMRTGEAHGAGNTTWNRGTPIPTPPGRGRADPVASPGSAGPSQRARRGGPPTGGLRYVLIPWETRPPRRGPTAEARGGRRPAGRGRSCPHAVMPLDVLGRTRATLTEPASTPLAGRPG